MIPSLIRFRTCLLLIMIGLTLLLSAGCLAPGQDEEKPAILVAVTIPPQEEMVREIGDGRVDVIVLIPPGSDPHTYEPSPGLVARASGADLYLPLGSGLFPVEDVMAGRLRAMNPDLAVTAVSSGVEVLGSGDRPDPHIWLSLKNARIMAENTRDALVAVDPDNEDMYRANADRYSARIDDLDKKISGNLFRNDPGMILVTHQAWGYFARDYGLSIVSIEQDGKEPTARDLERLITLARAEGVAVVFAEAQENRREAQAVADEIGGRVEVIDPLAPGYLANMERIATAFAGS
ncbi:MAG: zinc ABC transporter solute-binding protein [Methanomicrobiales archaeon]|nr:zinc ABC transporter solute-binding protein [Methanomicrobiales archaeon]